MKETKNFSEKEFSCKCGCSQPHQMQERAMLKVQHVRDVYGKPLNLTSAWRCKKHPDEARKKKAGQHNKGTAVDIAVSDGAIAYDIIRIGLSLGATGFAYGNGFVHLDWRDSTPVTWKY